MDTKYLLIVITRMTITRGEDGDEFVRLWKNDKELESICLTPQGQSSAWTLLLIHGYLGEIEEEGANGKKIKVLNDVKKQIESNKLKLDGYSNIHVLYHQPSDSRFTLEPADFSEIGEIKSTFRYSTEGDKSLSKVIEGLVDKTIFDEIVAFLPRYKQSVMNRLRHDLNHIFMPISIDLEGLQETGFDIEYWREIAATYAASDDAKPLSRARRLVYKQKDDGQTLEGLVNQLGISEDSQAWEKIQELLPPEGSNPPDDASALIYFEQLKKDGCAEGQQCPPNNLNSIPDPLKKGQNFFKWHAALEKALNALAEQIEGLKNPLS